MAQSKSNLFAFSSPPSASRLSIEMSNRDMIFTTQRFGAFGREHERGKLSLKLQLGSLFPYA
jgi:hypothetical protein